ncbi:MAG: hypothetical protein ACRDKW_00605, partial [Actinomycetota bacterium]
MTAPSPLRSRRLRLGVWLALPLLAGAAAPLRAADVLPGIDMWTTPGSGLTFDDFSGNPIPADFFDPGSDPFTGVVVLIGQPLPDLGPPTAPSVFPADTIVRRPMTAVLPGPGSQDTIPIEIVALNLVSVNPITVTYNGGQNPEPWDVRVCLSAVAPQMQGGMTVRQECPTGGTYDSTLPVVPKLVFTRVNPPAIRTLDPAPQVMLAFNGADWVAIPDPSLAVTRIMQGAVTDGNCNGIPDPPLLGTSNFVPGVRDLSCDPACVAVPPQPQQKVLTTEEQILAAHGILPAQEPPPDGDGDGVPDDADNCPADFNPLQEDADGDYV